jgi:hypothetical protein
MSEVFITLEGEVAEMESPVPVDRVRFGGDGVEFDCGIH